MTSRREARRPAWVLLYLWEVRGRPLGSLYEGEVDAYARGLADDVVERAGELEARHSDA
jgi:hypothetical protein